MKRISGGFSLIEVLVALLVLAVAVPALLRLISVQVDGVVAARTKVQAQWVANYVIANQRLRGNTERQWQSDEGQLTMMRQAWRWEVVRESTELDGFDRLTLSIFLDDNDHPLLEVQRYGE
ncbi:type II secretion system protein GspI [Umboniibacter marinipuniceus]|uniref:Type II secretion system protein I (GspI) n=1 Tax=Umboniibacter marinipuniceus TaxID=569599 RepID=A0A3M0AFR4_9GAMM|nr:type II secretion system protein GspI [Umboniibacter marinipuniceus]RMA81325.1 type II secretion system protein I (GspI) [Umboniibacter marinipuniceus]